MRIPSTQCLSGRTGVAHMRVAATSTASIALQKRPSINVAGWPFTWTHTLSNPLRPPAARFQMLLSEETLAAANKCLDLSHITSPIVFSVQDPKVAWVAFTLSR